MILSDSCYLKEKCWKYHNCDAECQHSNSYCPKLFRIDYLYNEALLTDKQRKYIPIRIDEDGTDREAFSQLKQIEQHIELFKKVQIFSFILLNVVTVRLYGQ